jgi:hypothetical protein
MLLSRRLRMPDIPVPQPSRETWINSREGGYATWDEADWARVSLANEAKIVRVISRYGRYYVEWKK